MNASKTGKLIYLMRKSKNLTQKELASLINVSSKAICKWEKGNGCPDITLLPSISDALDISIESILRGELFVKESKNRHSIGGNMNKLKVYRCKECNNIVTSTKPINADCCGIKLSHLNATQLNDLQDQAEKAKFLPKVCEVDNNFYIQFSHPMTKEDYICAAIIVYYDRICTINLYAEQEAAFTVAQLGGAKVYVATNKNALIRVI